ncbi:hypothetical protein DKX38_002804 [Salix brachista]|uniref:Uncharacterized protein n=1 Tax=Salix brachista TaxID=2182728 RepID=A0A5N5NR21_9ROSI|nr:hypothetical protein DKX38_002804 [Salix brachista]
MGSENPDDHQRVAGTYNLEEQKKRKRAESYEKSVTKPSLDDLRKFRKRFLELGESSGHAREAVGKQTHLVDSLWELIKTPLPGGGTCGGTSASTDKEAYPPLELSVAAMKPDGSTFNELKELYIASEAQHAQEKVTLLKLHAREMDAAVARHAREMAAAAALHAREMDAAVARHAREMAAAAALHAREMAAAAARHAREMDAAVARHAREMAAAAALHAREMDAAVARHAREMAAAAALHAREMAAAAARHAREMAAAAALHAREMAAAAALHAREMAAAAARHAREMDAAVARHAREMAAVKQILERLSKSENLDLKFDGIDFDQLGFSGDTHM